MNQSKQQISVPRFYQPWPHQQEAWARRSSGKYNYYFKLWSRQTGKDADDIEYCLRRAWDNSGTQSVYIGLDNKWITNNIFNKYIDGREFWNDYPEDLIDANNTRREVLMLNNENNQAPARIRFIGFLNDSQAIGSSYDNFYVSEASLYRDNAFMYMEPIWDQKLAMGLPLYVGFNGTPRGIKNVYYELLKTYTGCDDPDDFPGEHGKCYVDKKTIHDVVVPDGHGGLRPLYTEEQIEILKDRYLKQFGNLALYEQEYECNFTTVNAGLVYRAIEYVVSEKRYCEFNLDATKPVYIAFDISSKDKQTDATAAIIFQYYNNRMMIYDIYEDRSKSLVECISDISRRPYFHMIRFGALPWDAERSASSETPIEEARKMFPTIYWHGLERERVDRGIQLVREMLPNMMIHSGNCEWLLTCFMNYEYQRLASQDDWAAKPKHSRYSHLMDALRYAVMAIKEKQYLQINDDGNYDVPLYYGGFYSDEYDSKLSTFKKREKKTNGGLYY
jgi:hypothetical protein